MGDGRCHGPATAEVDRHLGGRQRGEEAGHALSRFLIGALEARLSLRDWRPVRYGRLPWSAGGPGVGLDSVRQLEEWPRKMAS
jgi:hypothetical protein